MTNQSLADGAVFNLRPSGCPVREILKTENKSAFFAINSKRVDFVIADKNNMPCAVVEYQGSGHWQNNARKRDAIKKLACEKAGIKYFDIPATYTGNELKPLIDFFDFIKVNQNKLI